MKALPWIVAGITIGAAVIYVITNSPEPAYASGDPDLERAAGKTAAWGTGKRIGGTGDSLLGKAKEGVGRITGNDDLAGEGLVDQAAGAVKDTAGQVAEGIGQTLHDLNR